MQAAAHDPEVRKKLGMKLKVAKDFIKESKNVKDLPKYKKS